MSRNIILLTFLYFIQGLPYGLQTRFLPVYLRANTGASLNKVALFRLLYIPWICKALWAPAIDYYGTKRKWLLLSTAGLAVTCALTSLIVPDQSFLLLCSMMALMNIFTATQDVAVDSIAVGLLSQGELGTGNTAQVVGYKLGSIFGGGMLVWFLDTVGWTGLFLVLTLLYVEGMMFVYLSPVLRNFECQPKTKKVSQNDCISCDGESSEEFSDCLDQNESHSKLYSRRSCHKNHSHHCDKNHEIFQKEEKKEEEKQLAFHIKTMSYVKQLIDVPATKWMLGYVIIYKLG